LIREYYPRLTAIQVKDIIMKSVVKVNHNVTVTVPGAVGFMSMSSMSVPFTDLCITGGIVNAYNALLLAAQYP
jgi:hypothetical protein